MYSRIVITCLGQGFGEDIINLSIPQNIDEFHFTGKDALANEVIVHLNVLGPGVEDGVPR